MPGFSSVGVRMMVVAAAAAAICHSRSALAQPSPDAPSLASPDVAGIRRIERDGLKLEIAPLTRDQTEAFLVGRGMSRIDAGKAAALGCFFRSAIANAATSPEAPEVRIALTDWRVDSGTEPAHAPGTRETWDAYWTGENVAGAAAVAFHWALFPSKQVFAAADHNWGFLTFMRPPGSSFALDVVWHQGGTAHRQRLENLTCAP